MAHERTIPILPCRDVDEIIDFYAALGFARTYRQIKPNPYAVVARGGIELHFFGIDGFEPAESYGSCSVVSPDPTGLYHAFAAGLRGRFGKLPVSGIPRITRPQKKQDLVASFSVIDPGGNWVRVSHAKSSRDAKPSSGDAEPSSEHAPEPAGLARVLKNATRLGDSHGDYASAAKLLDTTLRKHADHPAGERLALLVYRVEVAMAMDDHETARITAAAARALAIPPEDREAAAEASARLDELESDLARLL